MAKHIDILEKQECLFLNPQEDITNTYIYEVIEDVYELVAIHEYKYLLVNANSLKLKVDILQLLFGSLANIKGRKRLKLKIAIFSQDNPKLLRIIETFYLNRGQTIKAFQTQEAASTWLAQK